MLEARKVSNIIEVSVKKINDIPVIDIKGDVTAVTGVEVKNAYETASKEGSMKIIYHFGPACYINSGGLAFFIEIASESRKKKQDVCICGLSDHFLKIFKMVGLTRCFDIHTCQEDAMKSS
jgi:anti-anti-sigma factor